MNYCRNDKNIPNKKYQVVEIREDCIVLMEADADQRDFAKRLVIDI